MGRRLSVEEAALLHDSDPAVRAWAAAAFGHQSAAEDAADADAAAGPAPEPEPEPEPPAVEALDVEPGFGTGGAAAASRASRAGVSEPV